MSGLEVLTVIAGVAACVSAFADARQLYKDWKSKRDREKSGKNGRRTMMRSSARGSEDWNFDNALVIYSEYIAGYFQMVSKLEGERWREGDETCLELVTTHLQYFREEVLIVLQTKTNEDAVIIDWVRLTSVTIKVSFEYMIALDGQFQRISRNYFVHQSILDIRSVGDNVEKLGKLSSNPRRKYRQWADDPDPVNAVLVAAGSEPRDSLSSDASAPARAGRITPSDSVSKALDGFLLRLLPKKKGGTFTIDPSKVRLCSFALELLQDPGKMRDGWTWTYDETFKERKVRKYVRGDLPIRCPRCEQPFIDISDGISRHSTYHIDQGDLTPRFFAKHHLRTTGGRHVRVGDVRHACIFCFVKEGNGGAYDRADFRRHVLECKNWVWYRRKWYHLFARVPDIDYYPCSARSSDPEYDVRPSDYGRPYYGPRRGQAFY